MAPTESPTAASRNRGFSSPLLPVDRPIAYIDPAACSQAEDRTQAKRVRWSIACWGSPPSTPAAELTAAGYARVFLAGAVQGDRQGVVIADNIRQAAQWFGVFGS